VTGGPWDTGVANERTALAWRRSALSLLTVAGLLLHAALDGRVRLLQLATGVVLVVAAGWADYQGHRAYGGRARGEDACRPSSPHVLGVLSGVTVVAAAATAMQLAGWP
jgi:uncharacterized membrane protein YidH (DUF202 family)